MANSSVADPHHVDADPDPYRVSRNDADLETQQWLTVTVYYATYLIFSFPGHFPYLSILI
jgi:hypothetical protein